MLHIKKKKRGKKTRVLLAWNSSSSCLIFPVLESQMCTTVLGLSPFLF